MSENKSRRRSSRVEEKNNKPEVASVSPIAGEKKSVKNYPTCSTPRTSRTVEKNITELVATGVKRKICQSRTAASKKRRTIGSARGKKKKLGRMSACGKSKGEDTFQKMQAYLESQFNKTNENIKNNVDLLTKKGRRKCGEYGPAENVR